jgi:hypothetical protein
MAVSLAATVLSATEGLKLRVPKTINSGNQRIIFASQPIVTAKSQHKTAVKVYFIAKWGVHRFEYGSIDYLCKGATCRQASEPVRLAFFEKCEGLTKRGKPLCEGLVASSTNNQEGILTSSGEARLECELNPGACERSNEIDGFDDARDSSEDTIF